MTESHEPKKKESISRYNRAISRSMVLKRESIQKDKFIDRQNRRIKFLEDSIIAKDARIARLKSKVNALIETAKKRKYSNEQIREILEKLVEADYE